MVAYESFDCIWFALQTKEIGEVSHAKLYKLFKMTISVFSMNQVQNLPSEATILNRTKGKKILPLSDINDEAREDQNAPPFPYPCFGGWQKISQNRFAPRELQLSYHPHLS